MSNADNWSARTGHDVARQQGRSVAAMSASAQVTDPAVDGAIADVHVYLYALDDGQAQVRVHVSPDGPFAAAQGTDDQARAAAYAQLLGAIQRELVNAVGALGGGTGG